MKAKHKILRQWAVALCVAFIVTAAQAADDKKPNIMFIMGDDIGRWDIGVYNHGIMAGQTQPRQACQGRHAVHR